MICTCQNHNDIGLETMYLRNGDRHNYESISGYHRNDHPYFLVIELANIAGFPCIRGEVSFTRTS